MAAAPHTCSSACQCANQTPQHTHAHTHTNCVPTSPCMVRVSSSLKNPVFVPSALKKSVLMISFSSLCGCVFQSLYFYLLSFLSPPLTPFSFSCLHWKDTVNYLNLPPPPFVSLSLCLSVSPFIHLLNRPSRQADLFTGVHSVLKVFKHHWMLWGGRARGEWIHDPHSIPLKVSNSQYTLCYNRNTRAIYPPRFITSWLRLIYATIGLANSQHFF